MSASRAPRRILVVYPPGKCPEGWVLAHNNVRHTRRTKQGTNGFRYFYVEPAPEWKQCTCDWRREMGPHYSLHGK